MLVVDYRTQWISTDFINHVLGSINKSWSLTKIKGRVNRITHLPDSMVEVCFTPNWRAQYTQPKAGQFVMVTLCIGGINHQRAYSLVRASASEWVIAVKTQGLVSNYLAKNLNQGDVLELSKPQGEFTLNQAPTDKPLLFIAGGSGITPMLSLVVEALRHTDQKVTLLYYSRNPVYADVFYELENVYCAFKFHLVVDSKEKPAHFSKTTLSDIQIDPKNAHTFLCGAPNLMKAVNDLWQVLEIGESITEERFLSADLISNTNATNQPVSFRQKQTTITAKGSLLLSAEKAGLNPAFGCRMGICNTCTCVKVSGTVKNLQTGEVSQEPNESIKLCVSEALSPLELDA